MCRARCSGRRAWWLAACAALWPTAAHADLAQVWAVDDGTKVGAHERGHALSHGNGIYDPGSETVHLWGLRNEIVAFQVILEADAGGAEDVRVTLEAVGDITASPGVAEDPDRHYLGHDIEIFEVGYVEVRERSRGLYWASAAARPHIPEGPLPDPLWPHDRGIDVPPDRVRAVWIDVYIPRDTAPGTHRGRLEVRAGGRVVREMRVRLDVGRHRLPDRPTARTMLFFSGGDGEIGALAARYGGDDRALDEAARRALRRRHFQLARRMRVTLFDGTQEAPDEELRARLTGADFTPAAGYRGPGQGVPQDMYSIHTYGGSLDAAEARQWASWLERWGPGIEYFLYTLDEPAPARYPEVNRIAAAAAPVPGFVTAAPTPQLEVDIFAALASHYEPAAAARARERGKRVWIYNGVRPFTGTFVVDDVAISPRVNPWIQHRHGIGRWFYWESTYYRDFQGGRGDIDIGQRADNFSNRHGDLGNGDGLLIYPGRDRLFPARDRGVDRPLPSIRLANWRRGLQDVEYLALVARDAPTLADAVTAAMIPRALVGAVAPDEPVSWPEDGERWLAARRVLFDALAGQTIDTARIRALQRPAPGWRVRLRLLLAPLWSSPRRQLATIAALATLLVALAIAIGWRRRRRTRTAG